MNELDRRIAELKGLTLYPDGPYVEGIKPDGSKHSEPFWAGSDAKAFELVDELKGEFLFGLDSCADGIRWYADFSPIKSPFPGRGLLGMADSRPEAICRAYIAAVTWMREKGKQWQRL